MIKEKNGESILTLTLQQEEKLNSFYDDMRFICELIGHDWRAYSTKNIDNQFGYAVYCGQCGEEYFIKETVITYLMFEKVTPTRGITLGEGMDLIKRGIESGEFGKTEHGIIYVKKRKIYNDKAIL